VRKKLAASSQEDGEVATREYEADYSITGRTTKVAESDAGSNDPDCSRRQQLISARIAYTIRLHSHGVFGRFGPVWRDFLRQSGQSWSDRVRTTGCWRIGTSGWVYPHWRGVFYPAGLRQAQWFEYYTRYFDTVEINNTFYRLQAESAFDGWREQAPPGFLYAVTLR
jgi:hypothetical protein